MTVQFFKYNAQGKITALGEIPETMLEAQEHDDIKVMKGRPDPTTQYVRNGAVIDRPVNPAILDGQTLIRLPMPCTIHINAASYSCESRFATLNLPFPGTYSVRVEAFPHQDAQFTLVIP